MKHLGSLGRLALLSALALVPASCGSGGTSGGGGGRMYVLTCVLGCNNGAGGTQVSCGIVNTFENQDVTIQFSAPVNLLHVLTNPAAFKVFESASGISPAGEVRVDPSDATRLIFRPLLTFDPLGVPSFGFAAGQTYQIEIAGVAQGDPAPYVQSVDGKNNESRLLCTITTDQGLTDPVPGDPMMEIYVDEIDPISGAIRTVEINNMVGELSETSKITFIFRDIMNLGTVVIPATGSAPNPGITVAVDEDGNIADPSDQTELPGTYTFDVDQDLLRTTATYTPAGGLFPSGGSAGLRKIVINVPSSVVDLIGNPVANGGLYSMTPEVKVFQTATLPEPNGELFIDQSNMDIKRSGADWGETQALRLQPGNGGGSGRLGDLRLGTNESATIYTSPTQATGYIEFDSNDDRPKISDVMVFGDGMGNTVTFGFKKLANITQMDKDNNLLPRDVFTSYSLSAICNVLNGDDPGYVNIPAWIFNCTYTVENHNRIRVTYKTPGSVGNLFELLDDPNSTQIESGPTLTGGIDAFSFGGPGEIGENQIVTNFDFQANPGGTPPPITVDDGIFEFAYVDLAPGSTLNLIGDNVARLFARGQMLTADQSRIDVGGFSAPNHHSNGPQGGPPVPGGPGGSPGARGADRYDNSNAAGFLGLPTGPPYDAGVVNIDLDLTRKGDNALGVGKTAGQDGGRGGQRWPITQPADVTNFGQLATDDISCVSEQVGSTGSGGAYARDGGQGVAVAAVANSVEPSVTPNANPTPTVGGDFAKTNLPPAGTLPLGRRTLDPDLGFLEGGSGGGGGGSGIVGTATNPSGGSPNCVDSGTPANTPIVVFRSHSAAAGGGAGGGLQAQAGRQAQLAGTITATGGDGGGSEIAAVANGVDAAPGGGGSGGAVLVQSNFVDVAPAPSRFEIAGGAGGFGRVHGLGQSRGGDGSPGIIRAESVLQAGTFFDDLAQTVDVFDPAVLDQTDPNDPNGVAAVHWLSVGTWAGATTVPGSFSAAQSCWMKPSGNFFTLTFQDDSGGLGWDMDLWLDLGGGEQLESYRSSTVFGGASPQAFWGELFTENGVPGAPIVVRFQGAKSTGGTLNDPCNIDPNVPFSQIKPGSLTPWVRHPSELNAFSPAPDMCRFLILFDASHPDFGFIKGVTNVQVRADPD